VTFLGTIGAIDGTHIAVKAPSLNPEAYVNRKSFHSVVLQCVSDSTMRFAGYRGSVHAARVLRNSPLYNDVQQDISSLFPDDCHIVGDPAYPMETWPMVGFKDNGHLTPKQQRFNRKLSATRSSIERAFSLLKGRFRRLKMLDMNRMDLVPKTIIACCVRHNL